ncbi:MAG TPA: diguanylate cyclase [Anaeromyxobacteraceae bacterium]|nr:diguanylate cyclase [Anaeromyxobacteraceae bacterium]
MSQADPTGAAVRAPVGQTPSVRSQLAAQRSRPLLVGLYAAVFSDLGVVGAPARRRFGRFLLRSLPPAVAVVIVALVLVGAFETTSPGWPQTVALSLLALTLAGVAVRRGRDATAGRPLGLREQLELGTLFLAGAHAVLQTASGGSLESPLQPLVYLLMAFVVAFLERPAGIAIAVAAVGLELGVWAGRGASEAELPGALVHAGFVVLFGVLYHAVLALRVAASRRAEREAIERRLSEIDRRAREFRLLQPGGGEVPSAELQRRLTESAVVEVEAAVRGSLEIAEVALRTHTCAVFLLSDDDRSLSLRECRSRSDAVTHEPIPAGEGALGGAVRRAAPVRLSGDVKAVTYYADGTRPKALLAVPLLERRGNHVRGVIVADRLEAAPFGVEDERLLVTLAGEILRAVAAERLLADMKRSRDEKERFYEAIRRLNQTSKLRDVFGVALEVVRGMLPLNFGAVTLRETEGTRAHHLIVRATYGEDGAGAGPALEGSRYPDNTGLVASATRLGASLPGTDLDVSKAIVFDDATRLKGVNSLRVIPLKAGEEVYGTLVLGSARRHAFSSDLANQLEVVAMQVGESIGRARLFEQTERLATTDGLTGLLNHRTFQERTDAQLRQSERYGKRVSLLLCDIDHFKSVNDTYGHPVGDVVLKGVAAILAKEARTTDIVARYGGEEFAIVMPETDTAGALVIAERIRERIGKRVFETEQGPLTVTMSLGVATFPEDATKKAELVERADGCLYHAKRHGRNQSVSAAALRAAPRKAANS